MCLYAQQNLDKLPFVAYNMVMEIYHGSLVIVEKPEIRISDRFLDFGCGFYTTSSLTQASRWGEKLRSRSGEKSSFVSIYAFDYEKARKDLTVVEFPDATEKWLRFVCDNRGGRSLEKYDIVIGPVADDSVYEVVRLFELGAYDKDEALKRLKIEKLFNQILFHTGKSLDYLKYINYKEERGNGQ